MPHFSAQHQIPEILLLHAKIDPAAFRANVVVMQAAIEAELMAIMDQKAEDNSKAPASSVG